MSATIIDGKALAEREKNRTRDRVAELRAQGRSVRLDAVLAASNDDAAARVYAQNQAKMCDALGIEYRLHELPEGAGADDIAGRVLLLNEDKKCHAVMVHMPMPDGVDPYRIQSLIHPEKDVEGVNPANIGNIVYGRSSLAPCTALAVVRLIDESGIELRGKRCVVVGASDIVGKPVAVMLMRREATVISTNKFTDGLPELAANADVLVAAAGVPGLVKRNWVKPGAVAIDVGINRIADPETGRRRTVGDLAFEEVREVAGWVTPVPGGVGPVTVAALLENVVASASGT